MALPNEEDLLKKAAGAEDEIEVHIEEDGTPAVEIEVVDDTPAADRGRKALPEGEVEPTEEEMEEYSEAVQKRIRKMRHGLHDERRLKEAAARERDEAITIAQRVYAEKQALEARYVKGEDAFISQAKEKSDLAMASAKREYTSAYEVGDPSKMADAQEKMANIAAERREAEIWARQATERKESAGQQQQRMVKSQPSSQASVPEPDPDAKSWAAKNKWFGEDTEMTALAYGVHDKLVADGLDPAADASEYYQKLNTRMREVFPSYEWGDKPKAKPTSVVAPVTRTSKTARRVTLTQSQVAVAKRMGITPLQYAIELAKLSEK